MAFTTLIDPQTLHQQLDSQQLVLVDCRFELANSGAGRRDYLQRHIRGAVYADLDSQLSGPPLTDQGRHPLPSPARMRQVFGQLGIDEATQVVCYDDRNHMMAARLWWMLNYMGHRHVAVLDGGWSAWIDYSQSVPSETRESLFATGEETNSPAVFNGQASENGLVLIDQISDQSCLIDSRAPERYSGEVEPLDPVAGHIPGAKNFYYANNLNPDGTFKSAEALREAFEQQFADVPPEDATFYCGSGVSACVNLLAAAHAGFPISKLYVGSWSEWCRLRA